MVEQIPDYVALVFCDQSCERRRRYIESIPQVGLGSQLEFRQVAQLSKVIGKLPREIAD
jgi:hypothetical protein